jgi:hypothetical protein
VAHFPLHPIRLPNPHAHSFPKARCSLARTRKRSLAEAHLPAKIDHPVATGSKGEHWRAMGCDGTGADGTLSLGQPPPTCQKHATNLWRACAEKGTRCALGGARSNVQSPSHSLRSCSGPAGPLLASLKSIAAVSRFRSGDQRLISRDAKPKAEPSVAERNASRSRADRDNCFAALNGSADDLVGRTDPLDPMNADGLRRFLPPGWRHFQTLQQT